MSPIDVSERSDRLAKLYGTGLKQAATKGKETAAAPKSERAQKLAAKFGTGGTETGGVVSKQASLDKLTDKAEDEGILGGLKGALEGAGSVVGNVLNVLDLPRAAIVSGTKEIIDLADENIPGFSSKDDRAAGSKDKNAGASFSDFLDQVGSHYGFGDLIREEEIGSDNEWVNRGLGFVGDVALDPTSYVSFGAVAAARETAEAATKRGGKQVSRALLSREDIAGRLEKLVESGVSRETVDKLQDDVFRAGAGALGKDVQQQIGVRTGMSYGVGSKTRLIVPGTETAAKVVGELGGVARRAGMKGIRKTPILKALPRALESAPGAALVAANLGPREAWSHKAAWREATDQAGALGVDLANKLVEVRKAFPDADGKDVARAIERGGAGNPAAAELSKWFEDTRRTVSEYTGTPIAHYEDYLPHRLTAEFREEIAGAGRTGGKQPHQKMRSYRPGAKFLGETSETGTLDEMEGIAQRVIGDDYKQMFNDDAWDLASIYLNEIQKVAQWGGFEKNLNARGLSVELRLKSVKKRLRQQTELEGRAVTLGGKAVKQQTKAIRFHELADELVESASRAYGLKAEAEAAQATSAAAKRQAAEIGKTIPARVVQVRRLQKAVAAALVEMSAAPKNRAAVEAALAAFDEARVALANEIRNASRTVGKAVDIAPLQQELAIADEAARKIRAVLDVDDAALADAVGRPRERVAQAAERFNQAAEKTEGLKVVSDEASARLDELVGGADDFDAAFDEAIRPLDQQLDDLADEMHESRSLYGQEFGPKDVRDLRKEARTEAEQLARQMRGDLDAVGGDTMALPPTDVKVENFGGFKVASRSEEAGGEWDWWYEDTLPADRKAKLKRLMSRNGTQPEVIADKWNAKFGTELNTDEAVQKWIELKERTDAVTKFAATGRGADEVEGMLPSLNERGLSATELYGKDPLGHIEKTVADEGFARGIRRPEEIRAEQQQIQEQITAIEAQWDDVKSAADRAKAVATAAVDRRSKLQAQVKDAAIKAEGTPERPAGVPSVDEALDNVPQSVRNEGYGLQKGFGEKPLGAQTRGYYEGALSKVESRIDEVSRQLDEVFAGRMPPASQQRALDELWKDSKVLRGVIDEALVAPEEDLLRGAATARSRAAQVGDEVGALEQQIDEMTAQLAAQSQLAKTVQLGDKEIAAARSELRKIDARLKTTRMPASIADLTAERDELLKAIEGTEIRMVEAAPKDTDLLAKQLDQAGKDLSQLKTKQRIQLRFSRDLEAIVAGRKNAEMKMVGGGELTPAARKGIEEHVARLSVAAGKVMDEDELFNSANAARRSTDELLAANETELVLEEIALGNARGERARLLTESVEQRKVARELFAEAKLQVDDAVAESLKLKGLAAIAAAKASKHARESGRLWHEAATKVRPDEIEKMGQILQLGLKEFADGKWADPAIAEAVKLTHDAMSPQNVGKFLKTYDQLMTRWKAYSLLSPGFHFRNFMGAMFNNSLAGMDPIMHLRVDSALAQMKRGGIDAIKNTKIREAIREGQRYEIVWGDDQVRDIGDLLTMGSVTQGGVADLATKGKHRLGGKVDGAGVKTGGFNLDPTALDFFALKANQKAGGFVEKHVRLPLFVDSIVNHGMSVEEALERVRKFHFDYKSGLSQTERTWMKRIMPFYTWTRFNFPLQVEMMLRRPGRYTAYLHAKRNIEMGVQDEEIVPSYYSSLLAIHTPWKSASGDDIYLTPDLPFRDLSETFNTGSLIGSLSPAIKTPLELAAGKQFFSDIPFKTGAAGLQEMPKAYMPLLPLFVAASEIPGFKSLGLPKVSRGDDGRWWMQQKDAYKVDQSLPLFGRLRRMFPSEERYQERVVTTYLSVVGGVSSITNNDSQQYGELLRRERIIKDALKRQGVFTGEAA